jgi:hypothetical protein
VPGPDTGYFFFFVAFFFVPFFFVAFFFAIENHLLVLGRDAILCGVMNAMRSRCASLASDQCSLRATSRASWWASVAMCV